MKKITSILSILILTSSLYGCSNLNANGKNDKDSIKIYDNENKLIKTTYDKKLINFMSDDIGDKSGDMMGNNQSGSLPKESKKKYTFILKQSNSKQSNKIKYYENTRYVTLNTGNDIKKNISWKLDNKEFDNYSKSENTD